MLQAVKSNQIEVLKHMYYYSNLHLLKVVNSLRYRFNKEGIIYGIRCVVTENMYW